MSRGCRGIIQGREAADTGTVENDLRPSTPSNAVRLSTREASLQVWPRPSVSIGKGNVKKGRKHVDVEEIRTMVQGCRRESIGVTRSSDWDNVEWE